MKGKKTRIEIFDFFDYRGIERHLEKMVSRGWLLEKMGAFCWTYRRIEPQKLKFSIYYYSKMKGNFLYDPVRQEEFKDFQELCEHTGWKLVACSNEMQVFYNEAEHPVPIETDMGLKIENFNKNSKRYFYSVYIAIGLNMSNNFFLSLNTSPIYAWSNRGFIRNMAVGILLALLALFRILYYFRWKRKALQDIADGKESEPGFAETKIFTYYRRAIAGCFAVLFLVLLMLIAQVASDSCRKDMIEVRDRVWESVYHDEVPVGLEDMMELDMEKYSSSNWSDESVFLARCEVTQYPWDDPNDSKLPNLYYKLVIVKAPFLYETCRKEMFQTFGNAVYEPIEMPEWKAEEVYRLENTENELLIFYKDRILKIDSSWKLTTEQIALIRQKLINCKL